MSMSPAIGETIEVKLSDTDTIVAHIMLLSNEGVNADNYEQKRELFKQGLQLLKEEIDKILAKMG